MQIRQLEPHEYALLDGHEGLDGVAAPRTADYFIAEDDGKIVGFWCLIPVLHTEPVWIHPDYRSRTVGGRLWSAVRRYLDKFRLSTVYCFAASPDVASYLSRLGFTREPFWTYTYHPCPPPSLPQATPLEEASSANS